MSDATTQMRWLIALLIFLLGAIAGWKITESFCSCSSAMSVETHAIERQDSTIVPITIQSPPIIMRAAASSHRIRTRQSSDTTKIQVSCLDTLLQKRPGIHLPDTLHICYTFPTDSFAIDLRFAARDTQIEVRYLTHDSVVERTKILEAEKSAWYIEPIEILSSLLFGFLLGSLRR